MKPSEWSNKDAARRHGMKRPPARMFHVSKTYPVVSTEDLPSVLDSGKAKLLRVLPDGKVQVETPGATYRKAPRL